MAEKIACSAIDAGHTFDIRIHFPVVIGQRRHRLQRCAGTQATRVPDCRCGDREPNAALVRTAGLVRPATTACGPRAMHIDAAKKTRIVVASRRRQRFDTRIVAASRCRQPRSSGSIANPVDATYRANADPDVATNSNGVPATAETRATSTSQQRA
jgi:hypothetical protein